MLLVELLAKEWSEWPEGATKAWQSEMDLEVYVDFDNDDERVDRNFYAKIACDDRGMSADPVTREIWEAERRRIMPGYCERAHKEIPATPQWRGHEDGLPPVGTLIEWLGGGEWLTVEVVGHYHGSVIAVDPAVPRNVYKGKLPQYRPIDTRTPREKWIQKACEAMKKARFSMPNTDVPPMDLAELYAGAVYGAGLAKLPEDGE